MKAKIFLAIAAVALLAMGCSEKSETVPETTKGITFKATVNPAKTKALTDNGSTLQATWGENETIALVYILEDDMVKTTATITEVSSGGTATITATLPNGVIDQQSVTLIYPASLVNSSGNIIPTATSEQDGTLSPERDLRVGYGTFAVEGTTASLNGGVSMDTQHAICKFSIKDADGANDLSVSSLIIKDVNDNIVTTVTPATPTNILYVTLPPTTATLWFEATSSDGKPYIAKGTANLSTGMFYRPTLKMATIGNAIGANGKFYKNKTDAQAAGTLVSAVITYLGSETAEAGFTHGLAVATRVVNGQWASASGTHNTNRYTNFADALAAKESGSALSAGKDNETNFPAFYNALHNNISSVTSGCTKALPAQAGGSFLPHTR